MSKVEDFKANPHNLSESMDLSELSDGASMGEAHKVEDSPEHAERILVPFVLLFIQVQGLPSLRFFDT